MGLFRICACAAECKRSAGGFSDDGTAAPLAPTAAASSAAKPTSSIRPMLGPLPRLPCCDPRAEVPPTPLMCVTQCVHRKTGRDPTPERPRERRTAASTADGGTPAAVCPQLCTQMAALLSPRLQRRTSCTLPAVSKGKKPNTRIPEEITNSMCSYFCTKHPTSFELRLAIDVAVPIR